MERKLLLLGLLRSHEMYGYQLNEVIDVHFGSSIDLKKPTVYKLLNKMAEEGWLSYRQEQEGNRPPRRVYAITQAGKDAFENLLRESLVDYKPTQFISHIALAYLDALSASEALNLLGQRRSVIADMLASAQNFGEHPSSMQLVVEHQIRHLSTELEWVDEVIKRIETAKEKIGGN